MQIFSLSTAACHASAAAGQPRVIHLPEVIGHALALRVKQAEKVQEHTTSVAYSSGQGAMPDRDQGTGVALVRHTLSAPVTVYGAPQACKTPLRNKTSAPKVGDCTSKRIASSL